MSKQMENAEKIILFLVEKYCKSSACSECPVHDECVSYGESINEKVIWASIESSTEK